MHFEAPEEIVKLQASLARLLADRDGGKPSQAPVGSPEIMDRGTWQQLAALGLPALTVPAALGGYGYQLAELLPVFEELGRSLVCEPFLASSVIAAAALLEAAPASLLDSLMPGVASGATRLALAHDEPQARGDTLARPLGTLARALADGRWRLDGIKRPVLHGAAAEVLLVSARMPDGTVGLFRIDAGTPGLECRSFRLVDDSPAAELQFNSVAADRLADGDAALAALAHARAAGIAGLAAEAVGVARRALALTVEHLKLRQQFGRPLAAYQVLQHRVADMAIAVETLRSAAMAAACAVGRDDDAARADLARAKMLVGRHGLALAEAAVQLHGAIGMTTAHAVGNCLRRMTVTAGLFGDASHHAALHGAALVRAHPLPACA